MSRVYNFSAGPAVLPEPVLKEVAEEMMDYQGTGMSVMEMSHRSPEFQKIIDDAEQDLRDLMNIPDNYKVLFLQGGASQQFAMIPMNLMKNKVADYIIRIFSFIGSAVPGFLLALILIYVFSIKLGVLPAYGNNKQYSIVMPTITLGLGMTCKYIRQVRASILEELNKPYVLGARSRGVKESTVIYLNVLKNSMLTISTLIGLSFGSLLGGTCIVETIFMWPGLGKLSIDAILKRDYLLIQGYTVWIAVAFVIINLMTDLVYRYIDPRIKLGKEED